MRALNNPASLPKREEPILKIMNSEIIPIMADSSRTENAESPKRVIQ